MSRIARRLTTAALIAAAHAYARGAAASTFSVNPVQVHLSTKVPSTLLTIRNESNHELRFQLSAFAWDQTPEDLMQLRPTEDIIFYPPLVTLAPNEERKIRIGTSTAFAAQERAYRLFVEELPHLDRPGETSSGVTVLTKMGIPIFLEATRVAAEATLEALGAYNGRISFQIRNGGTTHFVAEKIVVRGFGSAGDVVLDRQIRGWYVLAGRVRAYQVDMSDEDCARITATTVEVQIGKSVLKERLDAPSACRP